MSSEGKVYDATWKKRGSNYVVSLVASPKITASDKDFDLACDELCLEISERFGDGEAVLNIQREAPIPEAARKYLTPSLLTLGWNESGYGDTWQEGLFENEYCPACRSGLGKRTSKPLVVKRPPKGNIGSYDHMMCNFLLVSKGLVSFFSEEEVNRFGLQKVKLEGRGKKEFFEVLGEPCLKQVGVKGGEYYSIPSWECASCHTKSFSCSHPELPDNYQYSDFAVQNDLPQNVDSAFIIEDNIGRRLICMSSKRWMEIKRNHNVYGILTSRLYVIPEVQADRDPEVRVETNAFG